MCRVLICPSGHHCPEGLTCMLVFAIFAAVLGMFQFGFNTGVINAPQEVLTMFIGEIYRERTGQFISTELLDLIWSITVSIFAIGGMIGGLSGGTIADWCGRKCGLLLNNAIAILGATLMSSSRLFKSVECLIIGRFFIGLNCGLNTHLVPMYLSEIAPMNLRGALGTVSQLGVTTGLLLAQVLGLPGILGTADGWPFLLGVAFVPAVLQLMLLPFCPESPRYLLITKGRISEARKALTRLRCTTEVDEDIEEMRMEESRASSSASNLLTQNQHSYSSSLGRTSLTGADQIYYHNNGTIGHHFTPNHCSYGATAGATGTATAAANSIIQYQGNSNYHHHHAIQHHHFAHSHGPAGGHHHIIAAGGTGGTPSDHHHGTMVNHQHQQQQYLTAESPTNSSPSESYTILNVILNPDLRMPLIIAIAMQLSQQLSGINAIFYYSTDIFTNAGLESDQAKYATLGVGGVMVVMTLVSIPLMDKMGRRTLHLWGLGGMFITSLFFTISLLVRFLYQGMSYVSIISSLLFVVFFAVGPGSIPWLITAELFSQGPRPAAMSIAVLINWSTNFIVGLTFPLMKRALENYVFLPYTCFLALFWTFTYHRVPETKNRTFEEISSIFKQSNNVPYTNEITDLASLVQQQQQQQQQNQQQGPSQTVLIASTPDTPTVSHQLLTGPISGPQVNSFVQPTVIVAAPTPVPPGTVATAANAPPGSHLITHATPHTSLLPPPPPHHLHPSIVHRAAAAGGNLGVAVPPGALGAQVNGPGDEYISADSSSLSL